MTLTAGTKKQTRYLTEKENSGAGFFVFFVVSFRRCRERWGDCGKNDAA
ncbi:hypothetical protein [Megasphaera vaginalis (ex Srinivasan et al. 2021)]|nr:hypothetical protein [Megasphaera vaginalis (ex Srinivasan et al. 2021)]